MLHGVLFQTGTKVPCGPDDDLLMQFVPWRQFGFDQMRQANLPLWNPHIFGGTPYFAGFQSALLYPPNWLHLLLPVIPAINWLIAIHLFAAGYFTYFWCRGRGCGRAGSILGGIMFMFCGQYFPHIFPGHLPHISLMVWVPILFLAIDKMNQTGRWPWCFIGAASVALQVFAGHPQYVYYTGLISALYVLLSLFGSRHRLALLGGYGLMYFGGFALCAVQLLAGMQAAGESVRGSGVGFEFASMFALPPENFFTAIAPSFLGQPSFTSAIGGVGYIGRCYIWEVSIFVSLTGLTLACLGAIQDARKCWRLIVLIVVALTLALGKHLPLYRFLYDYFPEFSHLRVIAKFGFFACLFACILAAHGFDLILRARRATIVTALSAFAASIALGVLCLLVLRTAHDGATGWPWRAVLNLIASSNETYVAKDVYSDADFAQKSARIAADSLGWAAATLTLVAVLLLASKKLPRARYGLIVVATLELITFANQSFSINPSDLRYPPPWLSAIRADKDHGDFRVVNTAMANGAETEFVNLGLSLGFNNLWGYDPGVLKRYAELLTFSQPDGPREHGDPDKATQYLQISKGSLGMFQMLRCRLALSVLADGSPTVQELPSPLPVAQLVPDWTICPDRNKAIAAICADDFDPRKRILLESDPGFVPSADAVSGPAEVVDSSTDWLEVKTTVPAPCILLITNNYSTGWRVVPLETAGQSDYRIIPANYTQIGIPLQAGSHHLRIEYMPQAFVIGKWISTASLAIYTLLLMGYGFKLSAAGAAARREKAPQDAAASNAPL